MARVSIQCLVVGNRVRQHHAFIPELSTQVPWRTNHTESNQYVAVKQTWVDCIRFCNSTRRPGVLYLLLDILLVTFLSVILELCVTTHRLIRASFVFMEASNAFGSDFVTLVIQNNMRWKSGTNRPILMGTMQVGYYNV